MIRIVTWNVNSVRIRLEMIKHFCDKYNPDILCLQEIKVEDDKFPFDYFKKMGYMEIIVRGEKSYNGVAILSKIPVKKLDCHSFVNDDSRHLAITIDGTDTELHNFYIPAGGDEPDLDLNPKFRHKIDYVKSIAAWLKETRQKDDRLVLLGDLNIAPHESDVWSHKQLLKVVSHTPIEVDNFNKMKEALDLQDASRKFVPLSEKLYSWWSYRNRDWRKSNRGRRLDHILVTKPLYGHIIASNIDSDYRDFKSPSDHVPVMVDLEL